MHHLGVLEILLPDPGGPGSKLFVSGVFFILCLCAGMWVAFIYQVVWCLGLCPMAG